MSRQRSKPAPGKKENLKALKQLSRRAKGRKPATVSSEVIVRAARDGARPSVNDVVELVEAAYRRGREDKRMEYAKAGCAWALNDTAERDPDRWLRAAIAFYKQEGTTVTKAAEIAGVSYATMKRALHKKGVLRLGFRDIKTSKAQARKFAAASPSRRVRRS